MSPALLGVDVCLYAATSRRQPAAERFRMRVSELLNQKNTVSVVVPVYQTEQYLPECLESLLNQTHSDFQIIIVDDCSPGNCREVVERYQQVSNDLKYVRHEKNRGILATRFTGADNSTSDYVGFLDSDDTALPHYVETLLTEANRTGADVIGSGKLKAPTNEREDGGHFRLEGTAAVLNAFVKGVIPTSIWSKFYKTELIRGLHSLRFFSARYGAIMPEDVLINVCIALSAPVYVHVPQEVIQYNKERSESFTNSSDPARVQAGFNEFLLGIDCLRDVLFDWEREYDILIGRLSAFLHRKRLSSADERVWHESVLTLSQSKGGDLMLAGMLTEVERQRRKLARDSEKMSRRLAKHTKNIGLKKENGAS